MISIEKASSCDVELITQINTNAYNDETNRFGPGRDGGPDGYNNAGVIQDLILRFNCYKILNDNAVIGWFWLRHIDDNTVELEDFCIDPLYHNKGYGYDVLMKMHVLAPDKKKWILGTPCYSVKNQYLYKKAGYQKIGSSKDNFLFLYEKICK